MDLPQRLLEVEVRVLFLGGDAHVAAGVEAPALGLDLVQRRNLAQAGDVLVGTVGKVLGHQLGAALLCLGLLPAIETGDVGQEFDLLGFKLAVGAVDLGVDVAGVEEKDLVVAVGAGLAFVQEPEGAGQGYGVEKVGTDGDHDIHGAGFDELLADL